MAFIFIMFFKHANTSERCIQPFDASVTHYSDIRGSSTIADECPRLPEEGGSCGELARNHTQLRPFLLRLPLTCPTLGTSGECGVWKNVSLRRKMMDNHFPNHLKKRYFV